MKKIYRIALVSFMLIFVQGKASAQDLKSAYFLDGYAYGHIMNPAKDYDRKGYVTIPALGYINSGVRGNLNVKDLLYKNPNGTGLTTFLNPYLSTTDVMSHFNKNNKLQSDVRTELIGFGFKKWGGFNTFNISARANVGANLPYELFDVLKNLSNQNYDISDVAARSTAWAEIGFGHSHKINDAWRIGGKFKILLGVARMNIKSDNLHLELASDNQWTATSDAVMEASMKGLTWGQTETKAYSPAYMAAHPGSPATYEEVDFDNIDVKNPGVGGAGFAIDLGMEWDLGKQDLVDGLKLSASLLDLGFIKWKNTLNAYNNGDPFVFNGFQDIKVMHGNGTKIEDQWDDLTDDLENLYRLEAGETTSKARGIGATLNIGVEYALPSYDKLSFGLLSTTRMQGKYSWNEERLSVTVSPAKAFEVAVTGAVGTMGASVGGVINVHPKGFNLFLGMDHVLGKMGKQGIPLKSNADFTIGINIPFGNAN